MMKRIVDAKTRGGMAGAVCGAALAAAACLCPAVASAAGGDITATVMQTGAMLLLK